MNAQESYKIYFRHIWDKEKLTHWEARKLWLLATAVIQEKQILRMLRADDLKRKKKGRRGDKLGLPISRR